MRFKDAFFSKQDRYSLGIDTQTGKRYLSIPVSNNVVDYEEYYEISLELFNEMMKDPTNAKAFADLCRSREKDHLLLLKPGKERGEP